MVYKDDASLEGLWLLEEESGTRYDDSENGNDLTDNNTVGYSSDSQEGSHSADFESADSEYLSITDASQTGLDLSPPFTICLWFKPESDNVPQGIVEKSGAYEVIRTGSTHQIRLRLSSNGVDYADFDSDSAQDAADGWSHWAVVVDGTTVEWFKDGASDNSSPGSWSSALYNSSSDFRLGRRDTRYADALIDEVIVLSRALSAAEVLDIYQNGIQDVPAGTGLPVISDAIHSLVFGGVTVR